MQLLHGLLQRNLYVADGGITISLSNLRKVAFDAEEQLLVVGGQSQLW